MVTGEAAAEAVALANDEPGLCVGLHLALSNARCVTARERIPDLVDAGSRFANSPVRAALRYFFSPRAREQLRLEIEAQFEAFAATGLELSHVDGHQHLHAHPAVLPTVVELALRYGARGVRVPCDPVRATLRADRSRPGAKLLTAVGHAYLARVCQSVLPGSGLATCDAVVGSLMSGAMSARYTMRVLGGLDCRSVEVFFHPSEEDSGESLGPNRGDMEALLDPRLREFVREHYELTTYAGLRGKEALGDLV
jgi:hopanoid biosynthesis associated protein HpnK